MPKKSKRRSVASYRAASLKAWRTRQRMLEARARENTPTEAEINFWRKAEHARSRFYGPTLDDMLPPERTINRIPKVEWK